jgi:hypothetical protein
MTSMQHSTSRKRQTGATLPKALDHRLLLYALAAGTAVAASPASHAEVVFTPSSAVFQGLGKFDIDLDNDGSTDVSLIAKWTYYDTGNMIQALFASGKRPSDQIVTKRGYAAALTKNTPIGPGQPFRAFALMETPFYRGSWNYWGGYGKSRCLGIRFLIHGEVHYGWIGFRQVHNTPVAAKLFGYAYEAIPDKGILAGDTGTAASFDSSTSPTSMEILATGHTAVNDRRLRTAGGSVN